MNTFSSKKREREKTPLGTIKPPPKAQQTIEPNFYNPTFSKKNPKKKKSFFVAFPVFLAIFRALAVYVLVSIGLVRAAATRLARARASPPPPPAASHHPPRAFFLAHQSLPHHPVAERFVFALARFPPLEVLADVLHALVPCSRALEHDRLPRRQVVLAVRAGRGLGARPARAAEAARAARRCLPK